MIFSLNILDFVKNNDLNNADQDIYYLHYLQIPMGTIQHTFNEFTNTVHVHVQLSITSNTESLMNFNVLALVVYVVSAVYKSNLEVLHCYVILYHHTL